MPCALVLQTRKSQKLIENSKEIKENEKMEIQNKEKKIKGLPPCALAACQQCALVLQIKVNKRK